MRHAARVIVFDPQGRVLLIRGHDVDEPERSWWFTIGGGIETGEETAQAAVREFYEETGLVVSPSDLQGPVFHRTAVFEFAKKQIVQRETFYFVHLESAFEPDFTRWTQLERETIDEVKWWDIAELHNCAQEVFPLNLAQLLENLRHGWDGVAIEIVEGP